MKKLTALVVTSLLATIMHVHAEKLSNTYLYQQHATDCQTLDLSTWKHPTRKVLQNFPYGLTIQKIELCNQKKYPIFTVEIANIDLETQPNEHIANKFFAELAQANAYWDYALVDTMGQVVYVVSADKHSKTISFDYIYYDK